MEQFRRLGFTAEEAMMLNDMFQAITEANQWDWMRTYNPEEKRGFVFSDAPELKEIDKYVQYRGHSGTSYGWTMRQMQYIAQHGLEGLAKARGVNFDWETFLREVESIPAFAKALRKFENGELTYAQMRELCG